NLNLFVLRWELLKDGKVLKKESMPLPDVAPGETTRVKLPYKTILKKDAEYFLNVYIATKDESSWAGSGHVVAAEQLAVHARPSVKPVDEKRLAPLSVAASSSFAAINGKGFSVAFDTASGRMISLKYNNREMLHQGAGWAFSYYRKI